MRVLSAERRPETGKQYHFEVVVEYTSGKRDRIWRRYKEFDALHKTLVGVLGPTTPLPKLTSSYFVLPSARQAVIIRMGQLQVFLAKLLTFKSNLTAYKTIGFFLHPTADDAARAQQADPESIIRPDRDTRQGDREARVLEEYQAQSDIEISLTLATTIKLINTDNPEWFVGEDDHGHIGRFPARCVEISLPGNGASTSLVQAQVVAGGKAPMGPIEEMRSSEEAYMRSLVDVRINYFPKLRTLISAPEAKTFFGNWAELIPASQVCIHIYVCVCVIYMYVCINISIYDCVYVYAYL